MIAALTGNIGSGKSKVAALFEQLGALIIDADLLAREAVSANSTGLKQIVSEFGLEILLSDGNLNRKRLAQIIFADDRKKQALEDILHPIIRAAFLTRLSGIKQSTLNHSPIIYVVPLFFESRYKYEEVDKVILVSAPKALCLERVAKRDNCSLGEAELKYNSQIPQEDKESRVDFIIRNDGDLDSLATRVKEVYSALTP